MYAVFLAERAEPVDRCEKKDSALAIAEYVSRAHHETVFVRDAANATVAWYVEGMPSYPRSDEPGNRAQTFVVTRYGEMDISLTSERFDIYVVGPTRTVAVRTKHPNGTYRRLSTATYRTLPDAYAAASQIADTLDSIRDQEGK